MCAPRSFVSRLFSSSSSSISGAKPRGLSFANPVVLPGGGGILVADSTGVVSRVSSLGEILWRTETESTFGKARVRREERWKRRAGGGPMGKMMERGRRREKMEERMRRGRMRDEDQDDAVRGKRATSPLDAPGVIMRLHRFEDDRVLFLADHELVVLDVSTGRVESTVSLGTRAGARSTGSPVLADLNGDGLLDVAVPTGYEGKLVLFVQMHRAPTGSGAARLVIMGLVVALGWWMRQSVVSRISSLT